MTEMRGEILEGLSWGLLEEASRGGGLKFSENFSACHCHRIIGEGFHLGTKHIR